MQTSNSTSQPSYLRQTESVGEVVHIEHHFGNAEILRDVVIGLSDGLTVPFALCAGLSTLDDSKVIVMAGFAGSGVWL
jgi:hypothetical protein